MASVADSIRSVFAAAPDWVVVAVPVLLAILLIALLAMRRSPDTAALEARLTAAVAEASAGDRQSFVDLASRLARIDAAQSRLAGLSGQISALERTLGDKQARGAFGEARLSDLLRDALPPESYQEQASLPNGRRVDALILLPAPPGPLAVDSKFPLEGFLAIAEAENDNDRQAARKRFARDVARHVDAIAERYILPAETADMALMFVPSEAVFAEIHSQCRDAVEAGYRQRVYIVSPNTLWATLNTARAILRDVRLHEAAQTLQAETAALVQDAGKLAEAAETARKRAAAMETDLATLARAAKTVERRGRSIAALEENAPNSHPNP